MDAAMNWAPGADVPEVTTAASPIDERRAELIVDALKTAITAGGEHRLFRAGKLTGLFPTRVGTSAEAALQALRDGLVEGVRTETRGKVVTEWVRATPKGVAFAHDHESPKSVLRELKAVLDATRTGVPTWMADARHELTAIGRRFEERAADVVARLDDLAERVEAALRRADTNATVVAERVGQVVPWAVEALEYLDQRRTAGALGDCPLPELFHAVRVKSPDLTLTTFHDGLRRLYDVRAVRLVPAAPGELTEPEHALVVGGQLAYRAGR